MLATSGTQRQQKAPKSSLFWQQNGSGSPANADRRRRGRCRMLKKLLPFFWQRIAADILGELVAGFAFVQLWQIYHS